MTSIMMTGFLLINKPAGMSSYGCIGYLKRILKQKIKIGHAGTLDPFATGLLIVALGRDATRSLSHVMKMEKTYVATGKCGELTDTLDCTGMLLTTSACMPSEQEIKDAIVSFGNAYEQIPPLYSALKHQGFPLYALTRKNLLTPQELQAIADSKRRTVQLYDLHLVSYDAPCFTISARVSHGTYIRTLINDIATRSGSCATTVQLARTAIGSFDLSHATDLTSIESIEDINRLILPHASLSF